MQVSGSGICEAVPGALQCIEGTKALNIGFAYAACTVPFQASGAAVLYVGSSLVLLLYLVSFLFVTRVCRHQDSTASGTLRFQHSNSDIRFRGSGVWGF